MSLGVASRFAVLCLDRDEPKQSKKKDDVGTKKGGGISQKSEAKKKNKPDSSKATNNQNGTKPKGKQVAPLPKQQQQKKKAPPQEQWDQWQKKDAEFVDGNYKDDIHQAILLSKLEFEKKKVVNDKKIKAADEEKAKIEKEKAMIEKEKVSSKKSKKCNKPLAMSLEQFNSLSSATTESKTEPVNCAQMNGNTAEHDVKFFERIKDDTREVLNREESLARRKARQPLIDKAITQAQYKDSLEKKDEEILSLTKNHDKLKAELDDVKLRNKKLCHILAQGEMQSKSELLVELDRVTQMKDELSSELSKLHILLEQERSKNRSLTDTKRTQNKKRGTSESAP